MSKPTAQSISKAAEKALEEFESSLGDHAHKKTEIVLLFAQEVKRLAKLKHRLDLFMSGYIGQ